jgi:hypothetical protein
MKSGFLFLSGATDVPTKTTDLAKGGYFNLLSENTSDFNSISTDNVSRKIKTDV